MKLTDNLTKEITKNFSKKNINVLFFETLDDAKLHILESIPIDSTVGICKSITLKTMGISQDLNSRGNLIFDEEYSKGADETIEIYKKALVSDYYIASSNAVSIDGRIINSDFIGNRTAAISFGPKKVFIVIGKNKLTNNWQNATLRSSDVAAPLYAKSLGLNPPCVKIGYCVDCDSPESVCRSVLALEGQSKKDRITLIIIDEKIGY